MGSIIDKGQCGIIDTVCLFAKSDPITSELANGYIVVFGIGGIELDDNAKTVAVDGDPVTLTPKEYDILRFLMQNAGTVFPPREIYRRVWEEIPLNADNTMAVHVRHIREKIEINPAEPRYLKVVWGKGYKMEVNP